MNFGKSLWALLVGGFVCTGFAAVEFREADITTVKNIVERNEGSGAVPAKVNDKLRENSKVSTAAASMAELTFADSSITRMGANTQFSFQSKERLVKLEQGTILIHTPPGNGGATVDCGGVTAAVSGTTFMASHDVSGNVMFVLLEGTGGLKVTAGGSTTIIRPGQAASVGADVKKEVSNPDSSGTPGGEKKSLPGGATPAASGEEKGGPGTSPAGGDTGGTPPPSATPKIQVFDVDVQKVVSTTPLIVEFKNELPSAAKIEKTVEVQQSAVKAGKVEKTDTEIVLIKHEDGDVMVGSPKVNPEESVVVNRKVDQAGAGGPGTENLDVETAAGPGAGAGTGGTPVATAPAPRVDAPTSRPDVPTTSPVNTGQTALQPPPAPVAVAVTARVNDASREFNQANPAFGFSITSGSLLTGHSLVTSFLTSATTSSGVAGSPYAVNFSNPRIVDGSGADVTSRYNLTTFAGVLNVLKAAQSLSFNAASPILTGNSRSMPVLGVQTGSPTYSILETDGRASVDSAGNVTVGKILGASSFTIRAAAAGDNNYFSAQRDVSVDINRNVSAIEAANPVRQLLALPPSPELQALDEFFYFTGKTSTYIGGPDRFFADAGVGDTDRTLANPGVAAQLYSAQIWDFFAARKFTADPGVLNLAPSAGKSELTYFGSTVDLGAANPIWQGTVDPRTASTSLGFRYLTLNSNYLPVFDKTLAGTEPTGFFDLFGSYLSPLQNFPVWDDAGGLITSADQVQINLAGSRVSTLAAGSGGIAGRGLEIDANGGGVQMLTSGDLNLKTTRVADVGSGASGEGLTLEARGKVKLGTDATLDLDVPTNAGLPEKQQVRLEARTDPINGNPLTGNLAVVRTGDSLELRNVTVRGFAETRLEKVNPTTKVLEGRVLISGSAVRDFKIKELVGAAVNADAKIQMMALDQNGALAGDMVVGGNDAVNRNRLPVEAKIASALKEAGETLPSATAGAMVDAKQIDLAARNLKFENSNLVAMNSITARANTILIQNSFMTVVRNQGMINMYVQSGLVNTSYGTQIAGRVNFDGANKFQIGSNYFEIGNPAQLSAAYGTNLIDFSQNGGTPQAGKVNVLRL